MLEKNDGLILFLVYGHLSNYCVGDDLGQINEFFFKHRGYLYFEIN